MSGRPDTLELKCAAAPSSDRLRIAEGTLFSDRTSLRLELEITDVSALDDRLPYVWIDRDAARELFNYLGTWLHRY